MKKLLLIAIAATMFTFSSSSQTKGTFKDTRDGKIYKTVKIGNQTWMADNLKFLPAVSPPTVDSISFPYYYVYDYHGEDDSVAKNTLNYLIYGVLYNWTAARQACPRGWHLPSHDEWRVLIDYIATEGHSGSEGTVLKATFSWNGNGNGTDNYLFKALPGGNRRNNGAFNNFGDHGIFWTETWHDEVNAWYMVLSYNYIDVGSSYTGYSKKFGISVRCVKD